MLKSMVASKAAKLMAACVCPVVGSAALTVSVPQVREAVHKATAPRQYAKPKTRVRKPAAEVAAAAIAPCPTAVPVVLAAMELPTDATLAPLDFASLDPKTLLNPPRATPFVPRPTGVGGGGGGGGNPPGGGEVPPSPEPPVPVLPDAATWAQMILGFGFIGGAMRYSRRRHWEQGGGLEAATPDVSVSFGPIRPESERPFA